MTEDDAGLDLIVQGNREMVVHAVRSVATEARFDGGRYRLEESIDSDYGPCLVIRADPGGFIGKLVLQESPRGLVVKIPPYKSEYDPDGEHSKRFKLALLKEFGRRGIIPQS